MRFTGTSREYLTKRANRKGMRSMIKKYVVALAVLTMTLTGMAAGDKTAPATLQDMTVIGTVTKMEKLKKDGTPMMTWFRLVDDDGHEIRIPKGKIEEFAGTKVKVIGKGQTIEKKGKSIKAIETITSIEKLADASPVQPKVGDAQR